VQGKEQQEAICYIEAEMISITNIVSNLHTFSDNRQRLTPEEIDLNDLIQTMLTLLQHMRA